jgi:hypothetical protein
VIRSRPILASSSFSPWGRSGRAGPRPLYLGLAPGSRLARRDPGEPGRVSQAHEGVVYGCCVPALTRFTNPHCSGPPRLTRVPAASGPQMLAGIVRNRPAGFKGGEQVDSVTFNRKMTYDPIWVVRIAQGV